MENHLCEKLRRQLQKYFKQTVNYNYLYGFLSAIALNNKQVIESQWFDFLLKRNLKDSVTLNMEHSKILLHLLNDITNEIEKSLKEQRYSCVSVSLSTLLIDAYDISSGFLDCASLWKNIDTCMSNIEFTTIASTLYQLNLPQAYLGVIHTKMKTEEEVVSVAIKQLPESLNKLYLLLHSKSFTKQKKRAGKHTVNSDEGYTYHVIEMS